MYPILLAIGPLVLPAWHTFYVLGAFAAFFLLTRLARRFHPEIPERKLARLYVATYVAGYFGSRGLSIAIEEPEVRSLGDILGALFQFGAMTFYGGGIASFIAGTLYVWRAKLRFADVVDCALPAGLTALAVGRVGCFLNGDDYGLPVPVSPGSEPPFWAVVFPNLKDGIARYPVQLLEAGLVGILVLALVASYQRIRTHFRPGAVGYFAIVGYANLRFLLEFLRGDFRGSILGTWVSTSQFISLIILTACGITLPFWLRRARP